ncbi:hypothetical protein AWV79_34605 [Cupriavidus sp. UYMMa02A]|nr:hypothetical protein AWV79_34605 [Cupriavidus sp. UYMMa02A]
MIDGTQRGEMGGALGRSGSLQRREARNQLRCSGSAAAFFVDRLPRQHSAPSSAQPRHAQDNHNARLAKKRDIVMAVLLRRMGGAGAA